MNTDPTPRTDTDSFAERYRQQVVAEETANDSEFLAHYKGAVTAYEDAERTIRSPLLRIQRALGLKAAGVKIDEAMRDQHYIELGTEYAGIPLPTTPLITKAKERKLRQIEDSRKKSGPHDIGRGV